MHSVRVETRRLAALALPVAATQVSTMLLGVVDTLMLGRFSIEALSAASLANVWVWGTLHFAMGILFGIDPIVAQAHGAGDGGRAAFALQRGLVLSLLLSLPLAGLWAGTEEFLRAMGQGPALAAAFQVFDGVQVVACGVLRGMGRTRPAAVFNGIGYWLLGLPLGGWLALRADWGLAGIWWGLCGGLAVVASLLVLWIQRRGPARAAVQLA